MSSVIVKKNQKNQTKWGQIFYPRTRQILFIVLFTLCTGLFINQASQCFAKYFRYETSISLEVLSTKSATFPSLTVSPDYHTAYKRDQLKELGMQVDDFRGQIYFPPNLQQNLTSFFEQITYSLDEIINFVLIRTGAKLPGTHHFLFKFGNISHPSSLGSFFAPLENVTWRTQYYLLYGRCFTLVFPKWLTDLKVLDVSLQTNLNTFIFFHHPGQFLSTDSKSKVPGIMGQNLYIDVEHDITYSFPRDLDGHSQMSCHDYKSLCYDDCIDDSLAKEMGDIFNCSLPFLRPDYLHEECRLDLVSEEGRLNIYNRYHDFFFEKVRNGPCIQSCSVMAIDFGYPFIDKLTLESKALVKMYFKESINVRRSSIAYSILSLIAELGSYMGLFLGFSCLNLHSLFVKIPDHLEAQRYLPKVSTITKAAEDT